MITMHYKDNQTSRIELKKQYLFHSTKGQVPLNDQMCKAFVILNSAFTLGLQKIF